ncbi:hypothetical protein GCM10009626_30790 [Brachybacterium sacelli]
MAGPDDRDRRPGAKTSTAGRDRRPGPTTGITDRRKRPGTRTVVADRAHAAGRDRRGSRGLELPAAQTSSTVTPLSDVDHICMNERFPRPGKGTMTCRHSPH